MQKLGRQMGRLITRTILGALTHVRAEEKKKVCAYDKSQTDEQDTGEKPPKRPGKYP